VTRGPRAEDVVGSLYAWWRGDPLPALPPLPGLDVGRALSLDLIHEAAGLSTVEAEARVREGNAPYLACLDGRPVAVGWSAHRRGHIGSLARAFELPPASRYLWDFYTVPELRGRGIYPRLLQAALDTDTEATRFWIGHDAENVASRRGILKAGFGVVGEVWAGAEGLRLVAHADDERARIAAALLGMPMLVVPVHGR
jgi:GNAT superfamily N-acetyltransferase